MSNFTNPAQDDIKTILKESKTIAVVGLSDNPSRTAYQVSKAIQDAGYTIIPVNPTVSEVLGRKAVSRLQDIQEHVDIVNVFRRREHLPAVAEDAASMPSVPDVFWTQLDLVSEEAARIAGDAGMTVIMDKCIKIEHSMLK
ncbi:CoA-binding protein [Salibacterium aidingense]|uniref:CoA-binding protein n=1 Tax=Salibacterium aidingense TaxID=384933 RepID=UPI00041558B1|nr:CoA-binding protein [Salibacterium aidingense]